MTNPQPPDPEDLLQDLLEGRLQSRPSDSRAGELAGLAARARHLRPHGLAPAARHRMVDRLNATFEGHPNRDIGAWLLGWLGLGHQPRAVTQRFAAGALLLSAVGSGAAATTDVSPLDAITGVARFAETAFLSLTPGTDLPGSDGTDPAAAGTATPTPTMPAATPGTPGASSTPQPGSSTPGSVPAGGSNGTAGSGNSGATAGDGSSSPSGTSTSSPSATPTPTGTPPTTVPGGVPSPTATRTATPSSTPDDGDGTPTPTKTPSPTPTKTPTPTPAPPPPPTPTATPIPGTLYSVTFGAEDAGWVRVLQTGDTLTVTEVIANPGWEATIESATGTSVEVKFENAGTILDFHAEIESGGVTTKVTQE